MSEIDQDRFSELARSRPNAGPFAARDWDEHVAAEFEAEVGELATALGYEHRVARLLSGAEVLRSSSRAPLVEDVLAALDGTSGSS